MAGLTVTEKEHWKNRIAIRIEKKIESIYAEDPNLKERIEREARERALASLKLTDLQQRLDEIELAKEELAKEQKRLTRHSSPLYAALPSRISMKTAYRVTTTGTVGTTRWMARSKDDRLSTLTS